MTNLPDKSPQSEIILYQTEDGRTRIEVRMQADTVWLSLNQMADLFQRDKSVISRHIRNIFKEGELGAETVVAKFATTAADGKTYQVDYFNLDVIISVGYRVKSHRGTQFRIWATQRLREYLIKGFALDDERLKETGGGNYFDELLARIRDIRSSEKVFWRKVLDKKGLTAFIQQIRAKFESAPTRDDEEKRFPGYERRRWGGVLKTVLAAQRNVDAYIALCMRIVNAGKSKYYDAALDHIEHAKKCYSKAGLDADWQAVVADVRKRHFRKKGFMAGFEDIVSGAPKQVEPSFLERAKARWPRKPKMS